MVLEPLPPRSPVPQLIASFTEQGRTGVAGPGKHVEAYLLPPCPIAERLLAAARAAAGTQVCRAEQS